VKVFSSNHEKVASLVRGSAMGNANYTSPQIKKWILDFISTNVQASIRKNNSDAKFSLLPVEAQDESKRYKMALVLCFVDTGGYIRELLFDLVHVHATTARTLKGELCATLDQIFDVQNIRGQRYDGAIICVGNCWGTRIENKNKS
jgi:hypothetical protein